MRVAGLCVCLAYVCAWPLCVPGRCVCLAYVCGGPLGAWHCLHVRCFGRHWLQTRLVSA